MIAVIVPETTGTGDSAVTTWQYKYVKSFNYVVASGKIQDWETTDDINQAYKFVVEAQPPGSSDLTAIDWIERFFRDTREGYTRANFAVLS